MLNTTGIFGAADSGKGGRGILNRKGIFLTFMAFLLASTLLALGIALQQAEIRQGENLAEEVAFREASNRFNNVRQQVLVAKEGSAGAVYGRIMPFDRFRAGSDWLEIGQHLPLDETFIKNAYDALNLFAVFAEEKGSEGQQVKIQQVLKNDEWGGAEQFPEIGYIVMPNCIRFSAEKDPDAADGIDDNVAFKEEAGSGCSFTANSIESYEIEVHLPTVVAELLCQNAFAGCTDNEDGGTTAYARVTLVWDNCPLPSPPYGFDVECKKVIAANLNQGIADWIEVRIGGNDFVKIRFDAAAEEFFTILLHSTGSPPSPPSGTTFRVKTTFSQDIGEIALAEGLFDFSVKKPGFGLCRATSEGLC